MDLRLFAAGHGRIAVLRAGASVGVLERARIEVRRMWMATRPDGSRGVFAARRDAVAWLARR